MATTKATDQHVDEYLAARANPQQEVDCRALLVLLSDLTGESPKMWGPSIVGFGVYHYVYDSGRSGNAPLIGFAIRGRELVLYLDCDESTPDLLAQLGRHKMGKSCLYFKKLADLDLNILKQIMQQSIARLQLRYGKT